MVIEKAKRISNCLMSLKGIFVSDGMRDMRGKITVSKYNPFITWASTMCPCRRVIVNFVPLQSPCDGIRFRSSMIIPTFSFSS
jgi:hypothetical protein